MTLNVVPKGEIPLIAAIDVGTTSTRAILFNKQGQEVSKYQIEYSTTAAKDKEASSPGSAGSGKGIIFSAEGIAIEANEYVEIEELEHQDATLRFPHPGWVECKPMNILANVVQCFAATLISINKVNDERVENNLPPYVIKCIGVTNMRETTIVWSKKTGLPVVDYGIVWNDTRTMDIVNTKKSETPPEEQERLRAKTGLPPYSTYFSCSKLRWFLDNVPEVLEAYESGDLMFGTVDTWLIYHLTGNHAFVSDVTNASRTGFMNLDTLDYDDELLEYWGIDRSKLNMPKIVPSAQYYGDFCVPAVTKKKLTEAAWDVLTSFSQSGIPIQGCLGDQSSSLVGQMAFKAGSAKCTYGTGCFLLYNTGTKKLLSQHGALTTFGFWFPELEGSEASKPHFVLEGSVAVAGSVVQWLRDNLRLFPRAEDVGPLASRVPDCGGVVFVPAFSGLFAPYWDAAARGTILGMSQFTTASHIARAAIEGVCFQARAILKAMSSDAFGEGAKDHDFLEEIVDTGTYEHSPLSVLAVDGGMSKSDEVMQIQADILGPCVKVRRSPTAESTALGAAIAACMAYKDPNERVWKDLNDAKKWIFYGGLEKEEALRTPDNVSSKLKIFASQSVDTVRRKNWKRWEAAIERTKGWLHDAEGN
ncbi:ACL069Cp [Eremothecium gossypii ATCC 10895]|uniref:glycerol kinase n=1 Tax=Eremothecium gossypii (strain ATCC 10895 / CBS 109.51 / FGSC 9923 / NRRL Y-1056) TaxID=284811 RepID=Q75CI8_EREGS|nr:ACL069Cp [Eremothecium gossypii ATCC 10895]AAS51159.2 ACL069Cp [Eremothecium gossypii ATCC 10895]AEY95450.1 FACL069Cp [Eremothecium gossypii FDAG1]